MLAIIGGDPKRFLPYVDLYHRAFAQLGKPVKAIGVHSHGYVAETDETGARRTVARPQAHARPHRRRTRLAADDARIEFDQEADHGSLYVGAPETVARRIATTAKALGISRFDMKYSAGTLPHEKLMRSIALYGSKVMPLVRDMLGMTPVGGRLPLTSPPARIAGSTARRGCAWRCGRRAATGGRLRRRRACFLPSARDRAPSTPRY